MKIQEKEHKRKMKILVVNDDGIRSPGLVKLAEAAAEYGSVTVAAPASQCSAMSQRIHVFDPIEVKPVDFPAENVKAWSVGGTPADCVKAAVHYLCGGSLPDVVFSGINNGWNAGFDDLYSGTIGAAMEGLRFGIPSFAFSKKGDDDFRIIDSYLKQIIEEFLSYPRSADAVWSVNFPAGSAQDVKGIARGVKPSQSQFYEDNYIREDREDGSFVLRPDSLFSDHADPGSDIDCILRGYIAIGKVRPSVIGHDLP
jgi:5'-nucleotidase